MQKCISMSEHDACVGTKMCQCTRHTASQKDLLDGARLEIRLALT